MFWVENKLIIQPGLNQNLSSCLGQKSWNDTYLRPIFCLKVFKSEDQTFWSLFKVRRHVIGCFNYDIDFQSLDIEFDSKSGYWGTTVLRFLALMFPNFWHNFNRLLWIAKLKFLQLITDQLESLGQSVKAYDLQSIGLRDRFLKWSYTNLAEMLNF